MAHKLFRITLVCIAALALTACSEKLTLSANGVDLPNFSDGEPKTQAITTTPNNRKQQSITFDKANQKSTEKYLNWFKDNKWSLMRETGDPSAVQYIFEKEGKIATVAYSPRTGLFITIDAPPGGGAAAK